MTNHLLLTREAAQILGITRKELNARGDSGKLTFFRTPTGHRRYLRSEIEDMSQRDRELITPGEVMEMLKISPTGLRWRADSGKLTVVRTRGGHRRYWRSEVEAMSRRDAAVRDRAAARAADIDRKAKDIWKTW